MRGVVVVVVVVEVEEKDDGSVRNVVRVQCGMSRCGVHVGACRRNSLTGRYRGDEGSEIVGSRWMASSAMIDGGGSCGCSENDDGGAGADDVGV